MLEEVYSDVAGPSVDLVPRRASIAGIIAPALPPRLPLPASLCACVWVSSVVARGFFSLLSVLPRGSLPASTVSLVSSLEPKGGGNARTILFLRFWRFFPLPFVL